ncbi:MAG: metal-dependent transcriptional regulator [Lachnospiraceae bacterium]|nr:metal-dependent transcriptional regulator [Lachnospiraceae bacterium]
MTLGNSTEDYLKSILIVQVKQGYVRSVDIAKELGVTKPSVCTAMKKLREMKLIRDDEAGVIQLTKTGKKLAEEVVKKHTLIKNFLISIGVNERTAASEACKIEHAIGDETCERLRELYERKLDSDTRGGG